MVKKIGIGVGVLLVAVLAFAATRPDVDTYERSLAMAASPEVVYGVVSDFHKWGDWSPWEKLDPAMAKTYEGAPSGQGAIYYWKGNKEVGEGRMTIVGVKPSERVDIKLEFIAPFEATNETSFSLKAAGTSTTTTWTMVGHNNFMMKVFGLFMDMEKQIGGDFEKGLAQLKTVTEAEQAKVNEAKRKADEAAQLAAKAVADAAAAAAAAAPPASAPAAATAVVKKAK